MKLGHLKHGDKFIWQENIYKVGHADGKQCVYCTNIITRNVIKFSIDTDVDVKGEKKC